MIPKFALKFVNTLKKKFIREKGKVLIFNITSMIKKKYFNNKRISNFEICEYFAEKI